MWDSIQGHEELGGLSASEGRLFTIQSSGLREMDTFASSEYAVKCNEVFMLFRQQLVMTASPNIKEEQTNTYGIQRIVYLSRK